ncbi:hypothetical protein NECAME_14185 [Necator americanus]|uniref:Uncharacterized protein n=1 Tax=Necator americanus TaxID=51031 RepID=W2SRP7_NECAM|nr:hypothetical protein NECAME_14185 [Necator americanus]ETN71536.1 hypothetical protein NECAME_14185 [Necator americanus]
MYVDEIRLRIEVVYDKFITSLIGKTLMNRELDARDCGEEIFDISLGFLYHVDNKMQGYISGIN